MDNSYLRKMDDAAMFLVGKGRYAMTTDSFVVDPIFFPCGDIGKLAVCGTLNDLASCAAEPLYMSAGFIIEEGFSVENLRRVVRSMASEMKRSRVPLVTGDTKVVPRGKADGVFINTTGIGRVRRRLDASLIKPGDKILVTGPIAEHGLSVYLAREKWDYSSPLKSDCQNLWPIVKYVLQSHIDIHFMRDPTRGGVSMVVNEIAAASKRSVILWEKSIPLRKTCRDLCDMLGLNPLEVANEGKMVMIVPAASADRAVRLLRRHPSGQGARVIGEILRDRQARCYLKTGIGSTNVLTAPLGESLPRIC
jgi:hydrogenase expression/formation protein HypE